MKKIILIITGIAIVGVLGTVFLHTGKIPSEFQLKTPKNNIISYQIKNGTAFYTYKDKPMEALENEIISKRINNTRYFETGAPDKISMEVSVGNPYYKDENDKWYYVNSATTTKEYFAKQTKPTLVEIILGEKTLADTLDKQVGTGADDGWNLTGGWGFDTSASYAAIGFDNGYDYQNMSAFFRFNNITIPSGSTITNAYIELSPTGDTQSWTPQMKVYGIKQASPAAAPTTQAEFNTDPLTNAAIDWDVNMIPNQYWYNSPSITAIIQELVTSYAYSNGSMMFQIKNDGGTTDRYNTVDTYDGDPTYAAKLHIEYTNGTPPADTTPPVRSNGSPSGTLSSGTTQTTISLTTNENATCKYGTIANTSYASLPNTFSTTGVTSHSSTITGLVNSASYTYYVRCQDTAYTPNANTDDYTITFSVATPPPPDTTPPVRSNGSPSGTLSSGTTQTTLSLTTNENAICKYGTAAGTSYASLPNALTTTGGTSHSSTITGLINSSTYTYYIRCQDTSVNLNQNTDDFTILFSVATPPPPDTTPPNISSVQSSGITTSGATITWTTDDQSTSVINYGLTTSFGSTQSNTSLVTSHSINITSLTSNTTYYYQVRSCNSDSYCSNSSTYNFTTSAQQSGSPVTIGSLNLYPSLEVGGVILNYTGDTDNDATVNLQWRVHGTSNWKQGMDMAKDTRATVLGNEGNPSPITNVWKNQFRAVILLPLSVLNSAGTGFTPTSITPNTAYDVQITVSDPDGIVGTNPVSGTFTTWETNPSSSGSTYYVSTTGNDSNDGLASDNSHAWKTLGHAAGIVNAGATVKILPGTYPAFTVTRSGTISNYITWTSNDINNPAVISSSGSPININGASFNRFSHLTVTETGGQPCFALLGVSQRNIIEYNTINVDYGGYWGDGVAMPDANVKETIIRNNDFYTKSVGSDGGPFGVEMDYAHVVGTVFSDNHIHAGSGGNNTFGDGINNGLYMNGHAYRNIIDGANDDGLEFENEGILCTEWSNILTNCGASALAIAPVTVGPLYVFKNVIYGHAVGDGGGAAGLKEGYSSDGFVYFYHNTYAYGAESLVTDSADNPTRHQTNVIYRNNIFYNTAGGYVIQYNGYGDGDWDYDLMYNGSSGTSMKWFGTQYSYSTWRSAYPAQEVHGLNSNPLLTTTTGDVSLKSTSPAKDAGTVIKGFDDVDSAWSYTGSAPDIGAVEYNSGSPTYTVGDLNKDGKVNIYDVSILLSKWASTNSADLTLCDINAGPNNVSQNKIDIYDANKMMANWRP